MIQQKNFMPIQSLEMLCQSPDGKNLEDVSFILQGDFSKHSMEYSDFSAVFAIEACERHGKSLCIKLILFSVDDLLSCSDKVNHEYK